jgi:hypothetical protein
LVASSTSRSAAACGGLILGSTIGTREARPVRRCGIAKTAL